MDFDLYLFTKEDKEWVMEKIMHYINTSLLEEAICEEDVETICIAYKYCGMFIMKDNIQSMKEISEIYDLKLNVHINMQIYTNTSAKGLQFSFKLINALLIDDITNMLFIENGDTEIIRKEDGNLSVIKVLDEYQKEYLFEDYFKELVYPK